MNKGKKTYYYLLFALIMICSTFSLKAQTYTEYEVKAGYLYNFSKFIKWPENTFESESSQFIIGIYNDEAFGKVLEKVIDGRKILDRNWTVKYCSTVKEIEGCQMLFIATVSKKEMMDLLEFTRKKPVLTVGNNIEEFCENGGIINFTGKYIKNRFQINNEAAKRSGFYISSKLLMLAKIITEDEIKF